MVNELYIIDRSKVQLNEISFSEDLKQEMDVLLKEFEHLETLNKFNLPINNKIILHGKTGCGKTMTAKAIANHLNKKLYIVNLGSIVSAKLGETAKNITHLFKRAEREKAVLFFDEFDSLGKIRDYDNSDSGEMKRVVNSILQLIDYLPTTSILIAATNQIHVIDKALLRRFDMKLEYKSPNKEELEIYYAKELEKYPNQYNSISKIFDISYAEAKIHLQKEVKKNILETLEYSSVL
ncbi:AAA family ATPase [Aureivirga marina]|uniref:AAA family ATPase n=1 Tax=Aureivirga marina TaxID=1182451 RepID=UPI0018CB4CD7|nr:ATP-binding protein [Aureivirga marina]